LEECYVTKLSLRWGNGELNGRKDETELLIMMEVYPAGVGTCRLDMGWRRYKSKQRAGEAAVEKVTERCEGYERDVK